MLFYVILYGLAALIALATGVAVAMIVRTVTDAHQARTVRRPSPHPAPRPARRPAPRPARRPSPHPTGWAPFDDYGLLRTVVLVERADTARSIRELLTAGGIRSTSATGPDGLIRILVFPTEYETARRMVSWVL
ncbi:hypothetical protein ACNTMW_27230 [Planosporangium sp. 12N6]|uniref:hypothetical protein n=1 Tax=Planosporangium spinosum TaxID=3402278 RepID=UPI003CF64A62